MCFEPGGERSSRNAQKANEFSSQAIKRSGMDHEKAERKDSNWERHRRRRRRRSKKKKSRWGDVLRDDWSGRRKGENRRKKTEGKGRQLLLIPPLQELSGVFNKGKATQARMSDCGHFSPARTHTHGCMRTNCTAAHAAPCTAGWLFVQLSGMYSKMQMQTTSP